MAARDSDVGYDQLHHFIASGVWDAAPLEKALLVEADRMVGGVGAWLIVDDTALQKKGAYSGLLIQVTAPAGPSSGSEHAWSTRGGGAVATPEHLPGRCRSGVPCRKSREAPQIQQRRPPLKRRWPVRIGKRSVGGGKPKAGSRQGIYGTGSRSENERGDEIDAREAPGSKASQESRAVASLKGARITVHTVEAGLLHGDRPRTINGVRRRQIDAKGPPRSRHPALSWQSGCRSASRA